MNRYAPDLFKRLEPHHKQEYIDCGTAMVVDALDEVVVKAVYHPLTRLAIAEQLKADAEAELDLLGMGLVP